MGEGFVHSQKWELTDVGSANVTMLGGRLGTGLMLRGVVAQNPFILILDMALAARSIQGDISKRDSLREQMLHTGDRNFFGVEGDVVLKINAITLRARIPSLFIGPRVEGLSTLQAVVTIGIEGDLTVPIQVSQP